MGLSDAEQQHGDLQRDECERRLLDGLCPRGHRPLGGDDGVTLIPEERAGMCEILFSPYGGV